MLHAHPENLDEAIACERRRAERERSARKQAEALLEQKSLELYHSNERLRRQAEELENLVAERTSELAKALEQARSATSAKSDFLATMSHEIRTPLNGIIGIADVLSLSPLDPGQKAQLDLLVKSGESLLALINDILDFSKIEAGHLDLEMRDFDPGAELESVAALFRAQATEKGLELEVRLQDLPGTVCGDSLRLRQIVANLLSNAVKFTAAGRVALTAAAKLQPDGRWRLDISVQDSGIGITPEAMGKLFEPFSQADSSTTRKFGGTGLGLAICRRLVASMGGEISVESGPGTIFRLFVQLDPAVPGKGGQEVIRPGCDRGEPGSFSVLIAADHPINQTVALSLLRRLGQRADLASTGMRAVEMVATGHYDLVLMDMQMPEMDGLEATRRIRGLPLDVQPRIVALTANAFESDRERCRLAGMDGFLSKPFRLDDIRAILCETCRLQGHSCGRKG